MRGRALILTAAAVLGVSLTALGQSLGDVARQEEQKKKSKENKEKKEAKPVRVYTEEDLKNATGALTIVGSEGTPVTTGGASEGFATEAYWRSRAELRRAAVTQAEGRIAAIEKQLEALRLDRSPTANVGDPFRLQTMQAQIRTAQTDLDTVRKQLEDARQALSDFEEEARRAGALPGWLRER
jgi:ABC-type phosphate transport system auxiliary subunit